MVRECDFNLVNGGCEECQVSCICLCECDDETLDDAPKLREVAQRERRFVRGDVKEAREASP